MERLFTLAVENQENNKQDKYVVILESISIYGQRLSGYRCSPMSVQTPYGCDTMPGPSLSRLDNISIALPRFPVSDVSRSST